MAGFPFFLDSGEKKLILPTEVASSAYYKEAPVNPSLIYGPIHLLRLMGLSEVVIIPFLCLVVEHL